MNGQNDYARIKEKPGGILVKKAIVMLLAAVAVLLPPIAASANSAPPSPYKIDIAVSDYSQIEQVDILGTIDGNLFELANTDIYREDTRRPNEKIIHFYNEDGKYKGFKLSIKFIDGATVESNMADFVEWGNYIYDVENNVLGEGNITSRKVGSYSVIFIPIGLALPLGVTLLAEWLVSLAFRLKPSRYVVFVNLVTNPVMNLTLLWIFNNVFLDYAIILLLMELAVAAIEFGIYAWKYKAYSKKRLLLFSGVANAVSWGVYYLISNRWF